MARIARKATLGGLLSPGLLALALSLSPPASGAPAGRLNIGVGIQGIALITDVLAVPSAAPASIDLSWTEPRRNGTTAPLSFEIRVSTTGQIADNVAFSTAPALSAFSPSVIPAPSAPGARASMTVAGLTPGVVYYFAIREVDSSLPQLAGTWVRSIPRVWNVNNFSLPSPAVGPPSLPPMEPFGVKVVASSTTVSFSWSPTTRLQDGTPFINPVAPLPGELQGYQVYRSTSLCTPTPALIGTNAIAVTTFSDVTGGTPYFYQIRSYNTVGLSTATLVLSSLGDHHYFLDDCVSEVRITDAQADMLRAATDGRGGDILISRRRRPEDTVGQNLIMQSAEFRAFLNGVTEISDFHFASPGTVMLHFLSSGTVPIPQAVGGLQDLGMFWNNGLEFKKLYGKVDTLGQTVTVLTPNVGVFQIRSMLRSAGAVFDASNVYSRVITPNGDGLNDVFIVGYDPGPADVTPGGRIYDLRGALVSEMKPGLAPNTLVWDGRRNGQPVTSGVYVYQIKGDGKTFNGTVVVGR